MSNVADRMMGIMQKVWAEWVERQDYPGGGEVVKSTHLTIHLFAQAIEAEMEDINTVGVTQGHIRYKGFRIDE
jgi:hypothetical protein